LQQQNVKKKASTKYAVKVLSDFMLEYNYDGEIGALSREVTFIENSSRQFAGNLV
jgi:hypothetical protein